MITYLYWTLVFGLAIATLFYLGNKGHQWKVAGIIALIILAIGWAAYFFHFQQLFVKRWGGVMTLSVPEGQ